MFSKIKNLSETLLLFVLIIRETSTLSIKLLNDNFWSIGFCINLSVYYGALRLCDIHLTFIIDKVAFSGFALMLAQSILEVMR